ncbi:MAG: DNA mismatch repair endonuclease MutL [bacterium]
MTVLPPELANQIAAGEVVERPSSVVKELVENSLDAGATRLDITIEDGGRQLIRVEDDGSGMSREDALRALERHATSKLKTVEDLFRIGTLGFRGEAVPSIGSVSRMEIRTKLHGEIEGTRIVVEGGMVERIESIGMAAGTVMTVEDLFFNTPARLKFMKTPGTEARHITEALIRIGLSRPDVRIRLKKDGKVILDLEPVEDIKDRILTVLGRDVYDDLYHTHEFPQVNGVTARGYFSKPGHTQRSPGNMYTFVNGRYVSDSTVRAAIRGAYGTMMEKGRHPSLVLYLDVPFSLVDVNVHPAKTEVRFHDTNSIFRAVYHAIADQLAIAPWLEKSPKKYVLKPSDDGNRDKHLSPQMTTFEPLNARHDRLSKLKPNIERASKSEIVSPFFAPPGGLKDLQQGFAARGASPLSEPPRVVLGEIGDVNSSNYFSSLKVIGQFKRMYMVCEDASGMVIIDQHAAHERIGFERLKNTFASSHKEVQPLLFPQRLELDALRAQTLEENLEFFEQAGFEIDPFGGTTFAIKAVPAVLQRAKHAAMVVDAIDDLAQFGRSPRMEEAMESVLSCMACHSVVRGPTALSTAEMESLLVQMDEIDFKANCPHGRPVYYRIPLFELEESFDRR